MKERPTRPPFSARVCPVVCQWKKSCVMDDAVLKKFVYDFAAAFAAQPGK